MRMRKGGRGGIGMMSRDGMCKIGIAGVVLYAWRGKAEDAFGLCIAWYGVSIAGWQAGWEALLVRYIVHDLCRPRRDGIRVWCFVAVQLRFLYTACTA